MEQINYNPEYFEQRFAPDQAPDLNRGSEANRSAMSNSMQQLINATQRDQNISAANLRQQQKDREALSNFSRTLYNKLESEATKYISDQDIEGFLWAQDNPKSIPDDGISAQDRADATATIDAAGKTSSEDADVVVPLAGRSKWFRRGAEKGYALNAVQTEYTPFIQNQVMQIMQQNPDTPVSVAVAQAKKEFWKQSGIDRKSLDKEFLVKQLFPSLNRQDAAIIGGMRKRTAADQSAVLQSEAFTAYRADNDLGKLLGTLKFTTDANGNQLGFTGAWALWEDRTADEMLNGKLTATQLNAQRNQPIPGDPKGRTFGQLYGRRFDNAERKAQQARVTRFNASQNNKIIGAKEDEVKIMETLGDEDGFNRETALEEARKLEQKYAGTGFSAERLRAMAASQSLEAKTAEREKPIIESLRSMGLLTPERLKQFSLDSQKAYGNIAAQQGKVRSNPAVKDAEDILDDAVEQGPDGQPRINITAGGQKSPTVGIVKGRVKQYFRMRLQELELANPGDPNNINVAREDARLYFNETFKTDINGYVGVTASPDEVRRQRIITNDRLESLKENLKTPNIIDKPFGLLDEAELETASEGFEEGGWVPNARLSYIADKLDMDEISALNRMRKASGMTELPQTPAGQVIQDTLTPAQLKALRDIQSPQVSQRVMGSLNKFTPELVPKGYGPMVQQAATAGGAPPAAIAALAEIESGWDPGVPSYNGSSFGLMQINRSAHPQFFEQNDWKDPQASLNYGAQYYGSLLKQYNNDPVAAAMAYNAGPGNYDAYLRGELPDGPIKTEMLAHGQKFSAAFYKYGGGTQALNSPPNLRPVYTTGNIGPTSTGSHLDVKQVGRGEFSPTALDDYVEIDDPEYGRVPLSKVGVTGDFASHTVRGSHGIDYGTHSGSPVYLKNGARVVSTTPSVHGDVLTIQLPNGQQYTFLHGKSN